VAGKQELVSADDPFRTPKSGEKRTGAKVQLRDTSVGTEEDWKASLEQKSVHTFCAKELGS